MPGSFQGKKETVYWATYDSFKVPIKEKPKERTPGSELEVAE